MARISEDRQKFLESLEVFKKQRARTLQLREEKAKKIADSKVNQVDSSLFASIC